MAHLGRATGDEEEGVALVVLPYDLLACHGARHTAHTRWHAPRRRRGGEGYGEGDAVRPAGVAVRDAVSMSDDGEV